MDPTLKITLVAAASAIAGGLITGIIAPHIAWGIEQKKQKLTYKRELIASWRAMLPIVLNDCKNNQGKGYYWVRIQRFPSFASLRPQLSSETLKQMQTINDDDECHLFLVKENRRN